MSSKLFTALLAFQNEAPTLQKDAVNPHFGNKYVSLDAITQTVTPLLCKHGLVWTTLPCVDEGGPALRYQLAHAESGECLGGTMPLMLSKSDSQGQGSALTYARRYAISAVLGLSAEDDDGNGSSRRQPPAAPPEPLATAQDVAELKKAAKGLNVAQIRLGFSACGLPSSGDLDFGLVPQAKAGSLAAVLAGTARES